MSVDKVESVDYIWHDGNPLIVIQFKEKWCPVLVETHWADRLTLWWDCHAHEYDPDMKLYAIQEVEGARDLIGKVEEWYEFDIPKALAYAEDSYI